MFTANPFKPLTMLVSPAVLQDYVVAMALAVVMGVLFDLLHEGIQALQKRKRAKAAAAQQLSAAETAAIAASTVVHDIATFGEFQRRISHVLMFYGFVTYLVTTVVMVFVYPADVFTPAIAPALWNIGIFMTLVGGCWFFFLLRINVVHDGHSLLQLERADLFIVTLLASAAFALLLEILEMVQDAAATKACASVYIFFTTLLFVSVPWSKFALMFYKPVVAFQKKVEGAGGASDLPTPTRCSPAASTWISATRSWTILRGTRSPRRSMTRIRVSGI